MTWTKLSDTFAEELEEVGAEALALHVAALCYCNRLLTDGQIPRRKARTLFPLDDPEAAITVLVESGRWAETETGYEIVDFLEDQQAREDVEHTREKNRQRLANWRAVKAGKPKPYPTNGHSPTAPGTVTKINSRSSSTSRNGVTNGVSNRGGNALPDPTRRKGRVVSGCRLRLPLPVSHSP